MIATAPTTRDIVEQPTAPMVLSPRVIAQKRSPLRKCRLVPIQGPFQRFIYSMQGLHPLMLIAGALAVRGQAAPLAIAIFTSPCNVFVLKRLGIDSYWHFHLEVPIIAAQHLDDGTVVILGKSC